MQYSGLVSKLSSLFSSFRPGKLTCVDLFELSLAKITEATHQKIKEVCSGIFRWKKTLLYSIPLPK